MNVQTLPAPLASNFNSIDASIDMLIAQAKEEEREELINILYNLGHLIDPTTTTYVASILRGGQHAVN